MQTMKAPIIVVAYLWISWIVVTGRLHSSTEQLERLRAASTELATLRGADRYADAGWFQKGIEWAQRYDKDLTPADQQLISRAMTRCEERIRMLKAGQTPWKDKKGKVARAYISKVDGSVQPYGLIIP